MGGEVELGPVVDDADGDVDLCVDDSLSGERAQEFVGDELVVFGSLQAAGDGLEGEEENLGIGIAIEFASLIERERMLVVARAERDERLRLDGAFEVEMELALGERTDEGGGGGHLFAGLVGAHVRKIAALPAVDDVDDEADDEPDEEAHPGHDRAARPSAATQKTMLRTGMTGPQRDAESAMALGLAYAQDEHAGGDEHEGEERADVGEIGERADVEQAGGNGDDDPGDPCGDGGRAEARMDAGRRGGQQAVAGHGEPDARLADLEDQDGRDHAHDRADEDDEPDPVQVCAVRQCG